MALSIVVMWEKGQSSYVVIEMKLVMIEYSALQKWSCIIEFIKWAGEKEENVRLAKHSFTFSQQV